MKESKQLITPGAWVDVIRGYDREAQKITTGRVESVQGETKQGVWVTLTDGDKAIAIGVIQPKAVPQVIMKKGIEILQQRALYTLWHQGTGKPICIRVKRKRIGLLFQTERACQRYLKSQELSSEQWAVERLDIQKHLLIDAMTDGMFTHYIINNTYPIGADELDRLHVQIGQQ